MVYSIGNSRSTKFVKMMRLGCSLTFLWYGQIVSQYNTGRLLHGFCKYAGERIVAHGPLVSYFFSENRLCIYSHVKFSTEDILNYFPQKTGFDISCKLSPNETICMECQILFSVKNNKVISKCRLLKMLPSMLRVNLIYAI